MAVLKHVRMKSLLARLPLLLGLLLAPLAGLSQDGPLTGNEKELKVAFLYNFALFTEWPAEVGGSLVFCFLGADALSREVDALQGKLVLGRVTAVQRKVAGESLKNCQLLFIGAPAISGLAGVLDEVRDRPVLTVADSVGAARQGVALNMLVERNKMSFEANLQPVRQARLQLSSKLLRLATRVYP